MDQPCDKRLKIRVRDHIVPHHLARKLVQHTLANAFREFEQMFANVPPKPFCFLLWRPHFPKTASLQGILNMPILGGLVPPKPFCCPLWRPLIGAPNFSFSPCGARLSALDTTLHQYWHPSIGAPNPSAPNPSATSQEHLKHVITRAREVRSAH